jgi:acyl-CoA dehydrogenase
MLTMGGALKRKEMLSARLGDILSTLYMASTVLKHYENQGRPEVDLPVVEWACRNLLYKAQEQLHGFLRNLPNRWVSSVLRMLIFPRGRTYSAPADSLSRRVVELMISPSQTRDRLCAGIFRNSERGSILGQLHEVMQLSIEVTPLEKKVRRGIKEGVVTAAHPLEQINQAEAAGMITESEAARLREADARVMEVIKVDDFTSEELARQPARSMEAPRTAPTGKRNKQASSAKSRRKDVAVSG